jgi:SAM-dependent methyltransferase
MQEMVAADPNGEREHGHDRTDIGEMALPGGHQGRRAASRGSILSGALSLSAADFARQLGKPDGAIGVEVGLIMNRVNAGLMDAAFRKLGLGDGERILEIGFGNGRLVSALLGLADKLTYNGIDISQTMLDEARIANDGLVSSGQASFTLASAEAIPFADAHFDKLLAVNVIYFWPDPLQGLREIQRVLRPGGTSVIAAMTRTYAEGRPFVREEYGFRIHDEERLKALHHEAGFTRVAVELYSETATAPTGEQMEIRCHLVIAQP